MGATKYYIVQQGDTLIDIALKCYGFIEGAILIMQANPGINLATPLIPGQELIIPDQSVIKTQATQVEVAPEPAIAIQQIPIVEAIVQPVSNTQSVKTITVQAGQSLADIALQEYGTYEGVILILQANPGLSVADTLTGGQELTVFTNYTVNLVKELVKVEPYASALQSLLAQWAKLIKFPVSGITEESDPVFMEWLATFAPFSGNYADLSGKPELFSGNYADLAGKPSLPATIVSSVGLTMPTGFSVSGQPITSSGVIAIAMAAGFAIPSIAHMSEWQSAYASLQEWELLNEKKINNPTYTEYVFTGTDLTQVNTWATSAKSVKLFTKDITYTSGNPTTIVLKDEITGKLLTTTITYSGSEVLNVTKVIS